MIFLPLFSIKEGGRIITKLISQLVITTTFLSINLLAYGEMTNLKGEYYEKDGCIYLTGNLTTEEQRIDLENYKRRMAEKTKQVNAEIQRNHNIKLAKIKAEAMRDYLIAQNIPLREVAEAIRNLKIRQSVNIGDVLSSSYLEIGDVDNTSTTTNNNTNTNDNKTEIDVDVKK